MANNERVAVAAHLHVALRRKAGRVTDTDWMAVNDAYAHAIVRFAREQAQTHGDGSLAALASRLEAVLAAGAQGTAAVPLVQRVSASLRTDSAKAEPEPTPDGEHRYIGGLR